jgi:hypothetical protein
MAANPAPDLRLVRPDTGEVIETECDRCEVIGHELAETADQLQGAEREIRAWRRRYANLKRDVEAEAKAHPRWDEAREVFDYWREKCRHPNSKLNAERFNLVEPYLRADGLEMCKRAIDGAAFDPFITARRNGSKKRHDGWELIFRDRGKFEEFVNKAPKGDVRTGS